MKIQISLSGSLEPSSECKHFIQTEVAKLLRDYPQAMKRWLAPVSYTHRLTSEFDAFDKKLVFSTYGLQGSVEDADRLIDKANKPDFGVGTGLKALIHHEFGHAVNMFIVDHLDRAGQDEWFEAKKKLQSRLPFPSTYSRKNNREHFAEVYALESLSGKGGKLRHLIDLFVQKTD